MATSKKKRKAKDPKRVATGKMSRRKGAKNERAAGKILEAWWGSKFRRTPLSGGWAGSKRAREELGAAGDLICEDPSFPFGVEVKSGEGWELEQLIRAPGTCKIAAWWRQTTEESPAGKIPLLLFTRKLRPWYAMTNKEAVLNLLLARANPMLMLLPARGASPSAIFLLEHLTNLKPAAVKAAVKPVVRRGMEPVVRRGMAPKPALSLVPPSK